jgi:RNA polymerase sigma factor (sigma-70 family)
MSDIALHTLLRHLRNRAAPDAFGALSDAELLRRVVAVRDQAAFEVLVWRHGPLVLGTCRRLLGHDQDAEDAFQATFLALARRAPAIAHAEALGGWLFLVACRVALRLRAQAHRRQARERQGVDLSAVAVAPNAAADLERREWSGLLIEEVYRLPSCYRGPIVSCYLQGKTHAEAARELARPVGSMSSLVARGCALLRARLNRRGVTLSAAAFPARLVVTSEALPLPLVLRVVRTAGAFAAGVAVPGPAADLANGVLRSLMVSKLKVLAGMLLVLGVLAGGIAGMARPARPQPAGPAPAAAAGTAPSRTEDEPASRLDRHGDPLPDHALARLGTIRFRYGGRGIAFLRFTPDGRTVVVCGEQGVQTWDAATGKPIHQLFKEATGGDPGGAALSPDGRWLATPGMLNVYLWEAATGRLLRTFVLDDRRPFRGPYLCAAFSPEGKVLATPDGRLNRVTLWDPATGRRLRNWLTNRQDDVGQRIVCLTFAQAGKTLVTASANGMIQSWAADTGQPLRQIPLRGRAPSWFPKRLAVSPDGTRLAVLATREDETDGRILVWDVSSGRQIGPPVEPAAAAKSKGLWGFESIAFTPNGKTLVAGADGTLYACDLAGNASLRPVYRNTHASAVAVSPDGKTVGVAVGATVCLVDLASGKDLGASAGHASSVDRIAVTPDARTIVTASGPDLFVWDAASGRLRRRLASPPDLIGGVVSNYVTGLGLIEGGRLAVSSTDQGGLQAWDLDTEKEPRRLAGPGAPNTLWAIAPDGRTAVVEGPGGTLVWIDLGTGMEVRRLPRAGDGVYRAAFTPDGRTLVACYVQNNQVCQWDVATGRKLYEYTFVDAEDPARPTPPGGGAPVYNAALSPDGRLLVLGSQLRFLEVRDRETGEVLRRVNRLPDGVCPMAFSPDGQTLAWAGWQTPEVHIMELATGRERQRLLGHSGRVLSLGFTADGRRLISGGADTTALVWDLTGPSAPSPALTARELDAAWATLADGDAALAQDVIGRLAASPRQAVALVRARLEPVPSVDDRRVRHLVQDLDSDRFPVREEAADGLEKLGEGALAFVRQALNEHPPLETRRRLEKVLRVLRKQAWNPCPERVRALRAVEVLERAGTAEAQQTLEALAHGAPGARLTEAAEAARHRLRARAAAIRRDLFPG